MNIMMNNNVVTFFRNWHLTNSRIKQMWNTYEYG